MMMRLLITMAVGSFALLALVACGDESSPADGETVDEIREVRPEVGDGDVSTVESLDATEAEAEVIFPGHPCGDDTQCSTGLCYGIATPQGAFESPKCQTLCLGLEDFARYCDSDDDCCAGTCCLGCGGREGLCVPETE